jgi:haloacetate dehalogenase
MDVRASPLDPMPLHYERMGSGPPLLLLHGFPQTHLIWEEVATYLSASYTLIMPDLRGYGASPKPESDAQHLTYSKRAMAADLIALMYELGYERFGVVGHDRGARVAHRLAMDHSQWVDKLMLLDISPTLTMYEQTDMVFAAGYWHWFFLVQQAPLPETMIGRDPVFFMEQFMVKRYPGRHIFAPHRWQAYLEALSDPACIHAMCEDYRASIGVDLEHDRYDRQQGLQLSMPVHVLWGAHGMIQKCFHPLQDWSAVAKHVRGRALDAGHYLPEECSKEVALEIQAFF